MALLNKPTQVYNQLPKFLEALREGQAPSKFNRDFLRDIGFKSSNHLEFIPLLKGLQFITDTGIPTQRYKDFLDQTKWKQVLAEAVKEAYGDIFVMKAKPTPADLAMIAGKYKSTFNISENQADRAARTFLALLNLSDPALLYSDVKAEPSKSDDKPPPLKQPHEDLSFEKNGSVGLHYNIQIHLPPTKDVEVYNAIFKSLREHLID